MVAWLVVWKVYKLGPGTVVMKAASAAAYSGMIAVVLMASLSVAKRVAGWAELWADSMAVQSTVSMVVSLAHWKDSLKVGWMVVKMAGLRAAMSVDRKVECWVELLAGWMGDYAVESMVR